MKKRVKFIVFCTLFLFSISYGAYAMYEANRSVLDRNIEAMGDHDYMNCLPGFICEGSFIGDNDANPDYGTYAPLTATSGVAVTMCGQYQGDEYCPQAGQSRNWIFLIRIIAPIE